MHNEKDPQRAELDMQEVLRHKFESGEGVVNLSANMPDSLLLLVIKQAASFGKPFTVIPAFADTVSRPGRTTVSFVTAPADSKSLLESLSVNEQQALHDWTKKQTPINGSIDMMAWPGWAEAVLQKLNKSV